MGSETRKYVPDFIVLVRDRSYDRDFLHLVVEIKGYRGEDAKHKRETMETCWIPGVNRLGTHGRWAFAELTDVYTVGADFADRVKRGGPWTHRKGPAGSRDRGREKFGRGGRKHARPGVHSTPEERDLGMILADTTVWVDHLRKPEPGLLEHLAMNGVLMHPMVIGELSCGNLPRRKTVLRQLLSLPRIPEPAHESVLSFIESKELMGRGVGFIDFHLL